MAKRFRIVGAGRAGLSFDAALSHVGWESAGILTKAADLSNVACDVDFVLLAVPDDAISAVASEIRPSDAVVIHLSGAATLDVLSPHEHIGSLHPLVSLPNLDIGAQRLLAGPFFAICGHEMCTEIALVLGGRPFEVPDSHRSLYHATACVAANHLTVLAGQVERLAAEAQVPVAAFWELMQSTLENIIDLGSKAALTGPAARGDHKTLEGHIAAIPDEEVPLYKLMMGLAKSMAKKEPGPA